MKELTVLKDGRQVVFRHAQISDAQAMIHYMISGYEQSDYLTRYPDEFTISEEAEKKWIAKFDFKHNAMYVAESDGQIIGSVSVNAIGNTDKVCHRCSLGITVLKPFWRMGLGRYMIQKAIDFASQAGYEQIELEVVTENFRGVPLYQSCGFEIYGTRPRAFKLRDGRYMDEYLMVKKIR